MVCVQQEMLYVRKYENRMRAVRAHGVSLLRLARLLVLSRKHALL